MERQRERKRDRVSEIRRRGEREEERRREEKRGKKGNNQTKPFFTLRNGSR
jgi:hypothetical protein